MLLDKRMASGSYQLALHGRKSHYVMPPRGILTVLMYYLNYALFPVLLCSIFLVMPCLYSKLDYHNHVKFSWEWNNSAEKVNASVLYVWSIGWEERLHYCSIYHLPKWRALPKAVISKHVNPNQKRHAGNEENKNCLPLWSYTRYTVHIVNKKCLKAPFSQQESGFYGGFITIS